MKTRAPKQTPIEDMNQLTTPQLAPSIEVERIEYDNHVDLVKDILESREHLNASPITLYNRGVRDTLYIHRDGYTVSFFKDGDGPVVVTALGKTYSGLSLENALFRNVHQCSTLNALHAHNRDAWAVYILAANLDNLSYILP